MPGKKNSKNPQILLDNFSQILYLALKDVNSTVLEIIFGLTQRREDAKNRARERFATLRLGVKFLISNNVYWRLNLIFCYETTTYDYST